MAEPASDITANGPSDKGSIESENVPVVEESNAGSEPGEVREQEAPVTPSVREPEDEAKSVTEHSTSGVGDSSQASCESGAAQELGPAINEASPKDSSETNCPNSVQVQSESVRGFMEHPSDAESDYKDAEVRNSDGDVESDGSRSSVEENERIRMYTQDSETESDDSGEHSKSSENEDEPPGARESGDGEEKFRDKVLDKDEDKKDPQYIPKRGMFYEHDDRTCEEEPSTIKEDVKDKKKKFVADKIDRWGHDMFDNDKQSPKTKQDLVDYYGYDIRNEEEPPKAWRSRRYGRGPNKYTRQWQDEAAYHSKRAPPSRPPSAFKQRPEDFPTMEESQLERPARGRGRGRGRGNYSNTQAVRDRADSYSNKRNYTPPERPDSPPTIESVVPVDKSTSINDTKDGEVHVEKSVFLNKKKPFPAVKTKSDAEAAADIAALSKEFSNAVINIGRDGKILPIGGVTHTTPTSQAEERKVEASPPVKEKPRSESKSKRYSTQRQRSLPQPNHLQQQPQQPQQFITQQQFFGGGAEPEQIFPSFQSQNPPPAVYPEPMPGVVFLPPTYPAAPSPHLINYGLPPPPPQQFSNGQWQPPLGAPAPPDLYPGQAGITYYSPQSQVITRPTTSRRVKVAIPIIAPPDASHPPPQS